MASRKCSDLIRQANSSRIKYVFSALVEIRKNCMKTPRDVAVLVNARLVKRLLVLIRSRDEIEEQFRSKVIDISLSILGNMCMEDVTRKQILKDKKTGLVILVELFEELEAENLQNRACRCLTNMLLDPGSWELVCCSSVIEKIVKLLQDTEKDEYKHTCIRAVRLLGQTGSNVQKLVEKNVISVITKLIDCDTESLKLSSLRCIHSLSVHGCSLQFARQVIASGKVPYLLTQVKYSNIEAFQIVSRLCEHHNFRAEFGNSGGITMFYEGFTSKELFWENLREDLLSVLCLCCKEAVNRVKLRDDNVLLFFVESLSDENFQSLHARIISALVCFLYDETSFDVLLDNALVPLLIKHLKSYFMNENDDVKGIKVQRESDFVQPKTGVEETEKPKAEAEISDKQKAKVGTTDKPKTEAETSDKPRSKLGAIDTADVKQTTENIIDIEHNEPKHDILPNISKGIESEQDIKQVQLGSGNEDKVIKETENESETSLEIREEEESELCEDAETECKTNASDEKTAKKPVYSIDSPSYNPNIEWELQDYQGATCIERFTPPHSFEYSLKSSYSPLSNSSYYSSGESSPEYSPPSSPSTSPNTQRASRKIFSQTSPSGCHGNSSLTGSQSPEMFHPKYPKYTGISCKLYRTSLSPVSPEGTNRSSFNSDISSPGGGSEEEDINVSGGGLFNCSDENPEDPFTSEKSPEVTKDKLSAAEPVPGYSSQGFDVDYDEQDNEHTKGDQDNEKSELLAVENENFNKRLSTLKETLIKKNWYGKRKQVSSRNNVTEYNILILLSRVSQMTDPTMHLVTKEVLQGLFDYMSIMEFPLARCPRLLSRVFRNPLCFNKLLMYGIPITIFDKLLKNEDLSIVTKDLHDKKNIVKRKSSYGKAEIQHEVLVDEDRFSVSDDSMIEEEHVSKRRRTSQDNTQQSVYFKGQYHKQEEGICNVGKSAMAFLEDLSGIVDVNYGWGAIDRLLHTVPRDQNVQLCINIISITWTQSSRHYFFNQREILDQVLGVFQPSSDFDDNDFIHAVNAIRLLVNAINTKRKYQVVKKRYSVREGMVRSKSVYGSRSSFSSEDNNEIKQGEQSTSAPSDSQGHCDERSRSCCISNSPVSMDTTFVVKNEKIQANRSVLVEKCEIFAAMLEGHYSEAQQSEISIPETSKFAFKLLVHHLHGCEPGRCEIMDLLFTRQVDKKSTKKCIGLLEESNKYMLTKLWEMAYECLCTRYLIPESVFLVLKYAVLHRKDQLLKASVSCVFSDSKTTEEVIGHLSEILSSRYADIFLTTLKEVLVE